MRHASFFVIVAMKPVGALAIKDTTLRVPAIARDRADGERRGDAAGRKPHAGSRPDTGLDIFMQLSFEVRDHANRTVARGGANSDAALCHSTMVVVPRYISPLAIGEAHGRDMKGGIIEGSRIESYARGGRYSRGGIGGSSSG